MVGISPVWKVALTRFLNYAVASFQNAHLNMGRNCKFFPNSEDPLVPLA